MDEITKRIKGCLVGCAYGDAMGMPTEMLSPKDIHKVFPLGVTKFEPSTEIDFINRKFPAGRITDDTINTILVSESIIEDHGDFCTEHYIDKLLDWVKQNSSVNAYIMGPNSLKALQAIKNGTPMQEAGKYSTTNGSAMKVSPIGIVYDYKNVDRFIEYVHRLCLPTHNTNIAISGSLCVAACVSYGIRGGSNLDELKELSLKFSDLGLSEGNQLATPLLSERLKAVYYDLKLYDEADMISRLQKFYGTGMEIVQTIPTVMAIVLLSNLNPIKASILAANIGGDTDTIGAIATAICGSINPIFEQKDIQKLEEVNNIGFSTLATKLGQYVE